MSTPSYSLWQMVHAKAAAYVDAFMDNVNWHGIAQTYEKYVG